ncbi:hypothetical protein BDR05DRAFT_985986 [Suillus weaverae]|nr:hypothetical protein BDR05DRAFT_985986 [Suillus weaverae]
MATDIERIPVSNWYTATRHFERDQLVRGEKIGTLRGGRSQTRPTPAEYTLARKTVKYLTLRNNIYVIAPITNTLWPGYSHYQLNIALSQAPAAHSLNNQVSSVKVKSALDIKMQSLGSRSTSFITKGENWAIQVRSLIIGIKPELCAASHQIKNC